MKPSNLDHEGCGDHSSMAILSYLLSEAQHKLDRNILCSNPYSDGCGNHSKENTEGEVSDIPSTPYKLTHGSASTMSTLRVRCPWYGEWEIISLHSTRMTNLNFHYTQSDGCLHPEFVAVPCDCIGEYQHRNESLCMGTYTEQCQC